MATPLLPLDFVHSSVLKRKCASVAVRFEKFAQGRAAIPRERMAKAPGLDEHTLQSSG